jgi:hypothetical protein
VRSREEEGAGSRKNSIRAAKVLKVPLEEEKREENARDASSNRLLSLSFIHLLISA